MIANVLPNQRDKSPEYYQYYPKLFHAYFSDIQEVLVDHLSKAGYSYYNSILYMDLLVDRKDFRHLPLMLQQQEECIKILTEIYGADSEFWEYWNKRKQEYFEAIVFEKRLSLQNKIAFEQYVTLSDKKSAFGKVAIDSLYFLSHDKNDEVYNILIESQKHFYVGFQLYDDIKDFAEDFENNQFNWAIYKMKQQPDTINKSVSILNKLLYINGIGQEILQLSIDSFEKSLKLVQSIAVNSLWESTINEMKQTISNYLDCTCGYIKTIEKRIETKNKKRNRKPFFQYCSIEDNEVINALSYIQKDYENNYADLKHYIYLNNLEGFQNKNQVHVSDTFQRAMLNDCLYVVNQKFKLNNVAYFNMECKYLINRINIDDIGGWSYFPTVSEIAADIDDLGQIIQLFYNTSNQILIEENCVQPIHLTISERSCFQGGFETWILPKTLMSEKQKKQEYFNSTKWGKGPDIEVVANFAYALELLDSELYANAIESSLRLIANTQQCDGYWQSRWYYGQYYGTYICLRLLKKYSAKFTVNINKAIEFILTKQNEDGGFSLSKDLSSDPLSTSFAALSMKLFLKPKNQNITRAVQFIRNSQNSNGSWNEVDFIMPRLNQPYKSSVMTTAIAIKALCK